MPEFIFTFGYSQTNPVTDERLTRCFTRISAPDAEAARLKMVDVWGKQWSFQYDSEDAAGVAKWNLREVPPCPYPGQNSCWNAQDERADPHFICDVHGQAQDTLERLGVDVL